jgi:hypothetical protein
MNRELILEIILLALIVIQFIKVTDFVDRP